MNPQPTAPPDWLAQTKFRPPLLRADSIPRPRLVDALRHALTAFPIILLSAPAGYGKTTLLAQCISDCGFQISDLGTAIGNQKSEIINLKCCWLSLDEDDNDPAHLLLALTTALRRLNPACGATAQTVLANLTNPGAQARQVIGVLINDILETLPDPFVLILDDLHLLTEPVVFVALDYLLERLPPQMHLAIATRHDPPLALPRLRARGQLAELRLADLTFTRDEAATFLNDRLRLALSCETMAALHARTEGWPVGLRLLASSLERIPTPDRRAAFIRDVAQTDRHVFDFLADEVLKRQEPSARAFLLETSILPELTAPLCRAVTDRDDAPVILEDLYRRDLFLVAVDAASTTFRYHALFAEFLQQRLLEESPPRVRDLHRRAAEQQRDNPSRAIRHYLAAEMWEQAVQSIEQVGWVLMQQGLLDTLAGWIHAVPIPIRDAHPHLNRVLGACAFWKGDFQTAQPLLERTVEGFQAIGDEAGVGESLADLASSAFLQSDFARAGALIERALAYPLSPRSRAQVLMSRTWLCVFGGDSARAVADLEQAVALTETGKPEVLLMLAFNLESHLAALPGGLECIERFCRLATPYCAEPISPLRAAVEELMAFAHFWRGRLPEAIQVGKSALAINERLGGYPFVGMDAAATVALAFVAQGDYAVANPFFDMLLRQAKQMPLSQAGTTGALWMVGHARWLQGNVEEARQVYDQMCATEHAPELPDAPVARLKMRGLLELASRRYAAAERILRQAVALERQMPTATILGGSARLLLAHLYLLWDQPNEALAELTPVLAECEQQDVAGRVLLEGTAAVPLLRLAVERNIHPTVAAHLLDVLGASDESRPLRVPGTGEVLTAREVEVLHLLVQGTSNRAIAERLVIGEGTVKSHLHHIFRKLDVASRTEAVARARELRLI
jgi:LuxR family maltose regulon positive regulatory protein